MKCALQREDLFVPNLFSFGVYIAELPSQGWMNWIRCSARCLLKAWSWLTERDRFSKGHFTLTEHQWIKSGPSKQDLGWKQRFLQSNLVTLNQGLKMELLCIQRRPISGGAKRLARLNWSALTLPLHQSQGSNFSNSHNLQVLLQNLYNWIVEMAQDHPATIAIGYGFSFISIACDFFWLTHPILWQQLVPGPALPLDNSKATFLLLQRGLRRAICIAFKTRSSIDVSNWDRSASLISVGLPFHVDTSSSFAPNPQ